MPLPTVMEPLFPELVVPDVNDNNPLRPLVPLAADFKTIAPVVVVVPPPLVTVTAPPVAAAPIPPARSRTPP
jgi:hypothetical protein